MTRGGALPPNAEFKSINHSYGPYLKPLELLLPLHRCCWGCWVSMSLHHLTSMRLDRGGMMMPAVDSG